MGKAKWGVIGVVAGAISGVLFAPKAGKETREDIKQAAMTVKAKAQEQLVELQDEMTTHLEKMKNKAGTLGKKAQSDVDDATKQVKEKIESAKQKIKGLDDEDEKNKSVVDTLKKELKDLKAKLK